MSFSKGEIKVTDSSNSDEVVLTRNVRFSEIGSAGARVRSCNKAGRLGPPAGFSTSLRGSTGFWTHGSLEAAVWQWISRLRSEQQAGQDQQIEAGDREAHILLKVGPALPGAASQTEDSLEHRDPTFDPGPKASQLPIDPTGTRHLLNLQPAFLGEGDVSDALVFGPLQVGLGGEASIEADLSRPAAVEVVLTLEPGLGLSDIVGGSPARPQNPESVRRRHRSGTACARRPFPAFSS